MNFQEGKIREQLSMLCLDHEIAADSPARLVDLFVEKLNLQQLGFEGTVPSKEGRPAYHPKDVLKLYLYGYLNRLRSSRKLEAECKRNIEVWWLLNYLKPSYHTIADFRKNNKKAFKEVFKTFVSFLKGAELFGGELIAVDGTKIRAQNNKKNNHNEARLKKHLDYIENKTEQYIKELENNDAVEDKEVREFKKKEVAQKLKILSERKEKYEHINEQLINKGVAQISTVDPDSRSLPLKDGITDVCYNVQCVADSKNSLIVDFDTVNETDQGQLGRMAHSAKEILEVDQLQVLADKGYHTGRELEACHKENIETVVAYPEKSNKNIDPAFQTSQFNYNKAADSYTCPQGAELVFSGKVYNKTRKGQADYQVKTYTTTACKSCPVRHLCTYSSKGVKIIERSQYQDAVDRNNKMVDENKELYKKRPQIIEHPFGTIKRGWGYNFTLLKTIEKVNGEMAIIFTVYNIRRAMSILGISELISRLKQWKPAFKTSNVVIEWFITLPFRYRLSRAA